MSFKDLYIDRSWTLFLDRDGVINKKLPGDYVRTWTDFEFIPGVVNALIILRNIFGKIVIVTNQQGIGKGLMTEEDLHIIHAQMQRELLLHNITIDRIYFSPYLASTDNVMRKPNPGMAFRAKDELPGVDLSKSIMVGDSESDILFGKNAGLHTVLISQSDQFIPSTQPDKIYQDLLTLAKDIKAEINFEI